MMKIALVCSHGGHLTEMQYLLEAFQGHDIFFVTYDSIRTRKLSPEKYLIDAIGKSPVKMCIAFLKFLKIFTKERPDIVVSTGSEIAIPAFFIAKLFKAKTIYVECWCRVKTSSGSGKIVYPIVDIFLVQWPHLVAVYGEKAQYQGAVL
jgi:UDP-N-acetylglucosamine:LPS N-acetylglucosamine transferase